MNKAPKKTIYVGLSFKDLTKLPKSVRDVFLQSLYLASIGDTPLDSKVLKGFGGRSVVELIEDYKGDTYRAVYTVKFKEAVYVLHVFKKKSNKGISTPKKDMDLVEKRLKDAFMHYKSHFN
jgi:phage-related protein